MSNVIPFRRPTSPPNLVPVYVGGEDEISKPITNAEVKTLAIAQLKKAIEDIETGHVRPDGVLVLINEADDDQSRLLYYTSGLNHLERLGVLQSAACALNFEDDDNVTGR